MFWKRRFPRLHKDFQITYRMVDQEKFDQDPINNGPDKNQAAIAPYVLSSS